MNIKWSRPNPLWWTDSDGVNHRYYPDFKINDIYIDTKNDYLIKIDADKIHRVRSQNNVNLVILTLNDINKQYINALIL